MEGLAPHLMLLAAVALITLVLLRRVYRRLGAAPRSEPPPRPPRENPADQPLMDAPPDVLRWHVEIQEVMQKSLAELQTRTRYLHQLVALAEEQEARLRQAIERAEALGLAPSRATLDEIEHLVQQSLAESAGGTTGLLDRLPPVEAEPTAPLPDRRDTVYRLADEGLPAAAIAEQVGGTLGDVEMILSLRGRPPRGG